MTSDFISSYAKIVEDFEKSFDSITIFANPKAEALKTEERLRL